MIVADQQKQSLAGTPIAAGSAHKHHSPATPMHFALQLLRISVCLLVLAYMLASLANNPYSPRMEIKKKKAAKRQHSATFKGSRAHENILSSVPRLSLPTNSTSSTAAAVTISATAGSTSSTAATKTKTYENIDLVLPRFPTLQRALDRSEVVCLYFGASWCQGSKKVTFMIDKTLGPTLQKYAGLPASTRRPLEVIYVSSDMNKRQYEKFNKKRFWNRVPFANKKSAERNNLKRYFKVSAKKEMELLQLEREFDIPFIVLLSGTTHKVLSKTGVQDLRREGMGVSKYWRSLAENYSDANAKSEIAK